MTFRSTFALARILACARSADRRQDGTGTTNSDAVARKHAITGDSRQEACGWPRSTTFFPPSTPVRRRRSSVCSLFSSIPSISAVPAHFPDCERAADWLVAELGDLGFEAAKRPTTGRPMVVGRIKAARREAPNVLFYGHYDVQPVDPLNLWRNPAVRAEARGGAARRGDRGARRLRRQGPAHDLSRGLPRLQAVRRPALPYHRAVRRRGGDRIAVAAGLPRRERQGAEGRHRAGLRHRHVGPGDARDHHRAARHRRRGGRPDRRQSRSALGPLRRPGGQSDPCAREDPRRAARRQRRGRDARLLRRRRGAPGGNRRPVARARFRRDGVPARRRARRRRRASATARRSRSCGRGRPARSTGLSAAIPARGPRPCCRPRPAPRSPSGSSASRTRSGSPKPSAPSSPRACRRT